MSEISCRNCNAACCKGTPFLVMQLSDSELAFMQDSGNVLQIIAEPKDYDRNDVRYPIGAQIHSSRGTLNWLYEKGRECEPLPAGFGRYALIGACKNLTTDEHGWEHCGVYDDRPEVCRNFGVATEKCVQVRLLHKAS